MALTIAAAAAEKYQDTLNILKTIVEFESPSSNKLEVDRLIDFLQEQLVSRNAAVDRIRQDKFGDLLVAAIGDGNQRPLLVMTHVDTVWPVGTLSRLPWSASNGIGRGPGIYDMKASVAMMLSAIGIIQERNNVTRPIVWLINTDEEVGSPVSRPHIERLALESEYVLCLEPPVPPDYSLKTERKGVGMFTMEVSGRASHAGADHQAGISAVEELARQIQRLHAMTDYERGTTVNVGVISGGTKRNVVAAHAEALIDLRVSSIEEAARVVPLIVGSKPFIEGAQVTVNGELNRPPMERGVHIVSAFNRAEAIAASIGQEISEAKTGGGSDGNFTAALNIPTIDGLGCPGDGAHAESEHIQLAYLAPRTALLSALLEQL